jgi:ribulose 1,5-bisphosphate carboxylase large subunit-like protein
LIDVDVSAHLSQDNREPTGNAVQNAIRQCVADAVEGSFFHYPRHLKKMVRLKAKSAKFDSTPAGDHTEVEFTLQLPEKLFPVRGGGLQHLVNLLAGDMFPSEVSGCRWSELKVSNVDLPDHMQEEAINEFRARAHDIASIRARFALADNRPLLAFSLKPRVGPTFDEMRRMTLDVLEAGFNVVELDARHNALYSATVEQWVTLGREAAQVGDHKTAFSPNLTVSGPQLVDIAAQWIEEVSPLGPAVIKVDGGLDGLTNLQSIRTRLNAPSGPIVTTYPILRHQFASVIGQDTWTNMLALSGADVIYPGGRPTFPHERRPVWGAHQTDWIRAAERYDAMVQRGWPMPTIAGGVHPGHLHACYELLGPKVAYFLGGAVALHPKSVRDGAELCVAVLDNAVDLAEEAREAQRPFAKNLPTRLLKRLEDARYPSTGEDYFPPSTIFNGDEHPHTFYNRQE